MRKPLLSLAVVALLASASTADVANADREAELLPANDEVDAFLELPSNLGRLRN